MGITLGVVGLTAVAWSGCSAKKQTELVAGVSSQVQVPRDFRSVRIDVNGAAGNAFCHTYPVYDGKVRLPRTLGVLAQTDPTFPVTITIAGFVEDVDTDNTLSAFTDCQAAPAVGTESRDKEHGGGARVLRRSRQPYVKDKILYLPMPLKYACYDVDCEKEGQDFTCKGGKCVPPDTDPNRLIEYDDSLIFGSSNTCFRPFTTTDDKNVTLPGCLDLGFLPDVVDANKCIYAIAGSPGRPAFDAGIPGYPAPPLTTPLGGPGLNVRVVYDNIVSEVLDFEGVCPATGAVEGYCLPDASKPQQFQLADGICHNPKHKITLMTASGQCAPKTELQPICDDVVQGPPGPTLADGGSSSDGGCNVAAELQPAPSALYVLMDKASGMRSFFGQQGLSQVIGLPLQDPVFSTTRIGFKFLPAAASECTATPTTYGDLKLLDVKLDQAFAAQAEIAKLIGTTTPLPDSPPMFLDAILRPDGAYKVLTDLTGEFNRRAVMLIIDRDVTTDCPGGGKTAIQRAADAFQSGDIEKRVYTYVVVLGNQDLADGGDGIPPIANAQQLAAAGGTTMFDVTHGEGATSSEKSNDLLRRQGDALNTVVSDLGSCLYEAIPNMSTNAHVAILGPTGPQDLPYSATNCNAPNTKGWRFDPPPAKGTPGRIRLCDQPCADLRTVLKASALISEANLQKPPAIPVTVTEPCDPKASAPPISDAAPPVSDAGFTPPIDSGIADAGADGG
jgi:hypothetical protein